MAKKNLKEFVVENEDGKTGFRDVRTVFAESAIRARLMEKQRVKDTAIITSVTQVK